MLVPSHSGLIKYTVPVIPGEIASADLIVPLEELIDWWDVDTKLLNAALKRCKGEPDPENERMWESPANRD